MSDLSETEVEKKSRIKRKYSVWTYVCDKHKFLVKKIITEDMKPLRCCNIEKCANLATTFGYVEIKW